MTRAGRMRHLVDARSQRGQALVVAAAAMVAIITLTGLVLMGGQSYWDRRHLQELADSAVLAAAQKIGSPADCSTLTSAMAQVAFDQGNAIVESQLGTHTNAPALGSGCAAGWTETYLYPNGFTATFTYPYESSGEKIAVQVWHQQGIQLGGLLGTGSTNITARAAAEYMASTPSAGFAVFAQNFAGCQGSSTIDVSGSIYSSNSIVTKGGCTIRAHALPQAGGPSWSDFGDIEVHQDGQNWGGILADGYEWSGYQNPSCGPNGYLDGGQQGGAATGPNPSPCNASPVPGVPAFGYPPYQDPNADPSAVAAFHDPGAASGVACNPAANYTTPVTRPLPGHTAGLDGSGFYHFEPGCYSSIDVSSTPNGKAVLDPGFYYFNGGGLCLSSQGRVLAGDVTLDFANNSNFGAYFKGGSCTGNNSACGNGTPCYFGADPASGSPPADPSDDVRWFAAPCATTTPQGNPNQSCAADSAWCKDAACQNLLIYSQPGTGTFYLQGPGNSAWLRGSIFFPSTCQWQANSTSEIYGQLVCQTVYLQGGASSSGASVNFPAGAGNGAGTEAALIE